MRCEAIWMMLDGYRTGELEPGQTRTVTRHLGSCEECSRELAGLRRLAERAASLRVPAPERVCCTVLENTGDRYGDLETDLGPAWVGFSARGISMVLLGTDNPAGFEGVYRRRRGRIARRDAVPSDYARVVRQAAAGNLTSRPPVDLEGLPPFERSVLSLLRRIPRGEVRTYSWLAREAGRPTAVRAVGNSMARNPVPLLLPCHRVVPAGGGVGNYAFGSAMKRDLLRREGVPLDELENLARHGVRYVGCTSTRIYCLPPCRYIRRTRLDRRRAFARAIDAVEAGYRPCRHCRPEMQ